MLERRRGNGEDLRCSGRRSGLPPPRRSDRSQREGQRDGELRDHRSRLTAGHRHEPAADPRDHLGALFGRHRLRAVPDLRRRTEEPDDPRDGLAAQRRFVHAPLHHARAAAAVRGVHATLVAGRPLPWAREVHGHAPRPRHVGPDEPPGSPDVHTPDRSGDARTRVRASPPTTASIRLRDDPLRLTFDARSATAPAEPVSPRRSRSSRSGRSRRGAWS